MESRRTTSTKGGMEDLRFRTQEDSAEEIPREASLGQKPGLDEWTSRDMFCASPSFLLAPGLCSPAAADYGNTAGFWDGLIASMLRDGTDGNAGGSARAGGEVSETPARRLLP